MTRFRPLVEPLEPRETPSAVTGRITGIAVDPAPGDTFYGTGVYTSTDAGQTGAAAPKSSPLPVLLVIADRRY